MSSKLSLAAKRLIDVCAAAVGLVVLSPVFAATAVLVKLDSPGPLFFRQQRLGQGGWPFPMVKFRSMHVNAPYLRNIDGTTFNAENDPRVTRVGRVLRSTSMDELPQLWNVLVGDMSLVGPRPDPAQDINLYSERDLIKLRMRPGMTSLAMVNGRNAIPWRQRMEWEIRYVESFSLTLDLKIMLQTVAVVLMRRGIHAAPAQPGGGEH